MEPKKIDKPIVKSAVVASVEQKLENKVVQLHEQLERPDELHGSTYKIKPHDHALYITINDVVLNEGTEHEVRRPFEIFINTKNIEHYQWVVGLTRVMSAVFRKGGDVHFLIEEMKAIFDPKGGYWAKPHKGAKGKFYPSVIHHIGEVLERHLNELAKTNKQGYKKVEIQNPVETITPATEETQHSSNQTQATGLYCSKCFQHTVIMQEGCMSCQNCGESKCG